jgi:hypothetical protein
MPACFYKKSIFSKHYVPRLAPELNFKRNYSAIGGQEIDDRRKEFLNQPGADRKQVEKEFRDAKAREAAAEQAGASHVGTLTGPARFRASLKVSLCSSAP